MAEPVVVVGGTVAATVAVERLAARGESVRWLHAGAPVGAGFRRADIGGRMVNLGPRLLELSYEAGEDAKPPPPWSEYRASHDGHRPWQAQVARYLVELAQGETRALRDPELWWRGVRGPDVYFTGDLRALPRFLDGPTLAAVASETSAILRDAPPGGVHHDGSNLNELDLTEASIKNHGATFHAALIDVLARRQRRDGTRGMAAALHNKLWLPLYWPRTLWEATAGQPVAYVPNRTFHADVHGGMSVPMAGLESRLAASPLVSAEKLGRLARITAEGGRVELAFADGSVVAPERLVLGAPPEELFAAAGLTYTPDRLELRIVWIDVAEGDLAGEPPSGLTVAVDESPIYRVSAAGDDAAPGRLVYAVELASGHAEPDAAALAGELARIGLLRAGSQPVELGRRALRAFVDPTIDNRRKHEQTLGAFRDRFGSVALVGGASGYGADPLNEQVLQGIRIAEVIS